MEYYDAEFYKRLSEEEELTFHKSGNIQPHNGIVCPNFEYLTNRSDNVVMCDDYFYDLLYNILKTDDNTRSEKNILCCRPE